MCATVSRSRYAGAYLELRHVIRAELGGKEVPHPDVVEETAEEVGFGYAAPQQLVPRSGVDVVSRTGVGDQDGLLSGGGGGRVEGGVEVEQDGADGVVVAVVLHRGGEEDDARARRHVRSHVLLRHVLLAPSCMCQR